MTFVAVRKVAVEAKAEGEEKRRALELSIERDIAEMVQLLKLRIQHNVAAQQWTPRTSRQRLPPLTSAIFFTTSRPVHRLTCCAQKRKTRKRRKSSMGRTCREDFDHEHDHHYVPASAVPAPVALM